MNKIKLFFPFLFMAALLVACSDKPQNKETTPTAKTVISEEYIWDLTDLYPDLDTWQTAREKATLQIKQLSKLQGTLGDSAEKLLFASDHISAIYKDVVRIYVYANLKADVDTRIAENQERSQLARNLFSDLSAAISWYNPELLALGEKTIAQFLAQEPQLAKHGFSINDALRRAPHTLEKDIETLLA
jgi:oligoendopeptidase F